MTHWYLDSSAVVKTVIRERQSSALRRWLADHREHVASELLRVEVVRAARGHDPAAVEDAREAVDAIDLIEVDQAILEAASLVDPVGLRSLDAVHLVSALSLGQDLAGIVTYDDRLAAAATANGIAVVSPR